MKKNYGPVWGLVIIVLLSGMFFPELMDTDAPEYAGIAMHMHQAGSWATIINRDYFTGLPFDYLDKPHMLYWSAWPGYAIFGVHDYSYRLLSVLLTFFAAFAVSRIGARLYNHTVGQMAALMFATSQAILLANHDVRTDSLLTSFCILCIWQLVIYIQDKKLWNLIWAGAFLAAAVGTKGMIAVLVCGCSVFFYLIGLRDWKTLFSWKWLFLVLSFLLFLSPILYCYYVQFDLHPEKFVNGGFGTSGVKFILWTQSFERFAGDRSMVDNPQFSFFFHTLIWTLFPWSLLCYSGVFNRLKGLIVSRGNGFFAKEQLTFSGVWVMFLVMSLSKFKLPHYLNVLFPLMCIFTAGYIYQLHDSGKLKVLRVFKGVQWVLIGLMGVLAILLNVWAFPIDNWWIAATFIILLIAGTLYYRQKKTGFPEKLWVPSAIAILLFNFLLNTNFYPQVDKYQGGSAMAKQINKEGYNKQNVYVYGMVYRTFDFYLSGWPQMLTDEAIAKKKIAGEEMMIFVNDFYLKQLSAKFQYTILQTKPDFHITMLNGKFINPSTRPSSFSNVYLVKII